MGRGGRRGNLSRLVAGHGRRLYPLLDRGADRRERTQASLVAVDAERLGDRVKWETSRGGDRFPHLYGALDPAESASVRPLPLGPDGLHVFPGLT
jgi:uncharacterized protein (DUF952 family)